MVTKNNFPNWAPRKVILEWEEKLNEVDYWQERFPSLEPDTAEVEVLFRLLTYNDMRIVWEKLPKYKIKPELFSNMVQLSSLYIESKPHNLTPKKYNEWLQEVKSTAIKLKELIQFSGYDSFLEQKYYVRRSKYMLASMVKKAFAISDSSVDKDASGKREHEYKNWPDLNPGLLSKNLLELAGLESDDAVGLLGISSDSVRLNKPNHPNAKRSYFIKKLTNLIREVTGRPLREIVTITTATVFDDPSITERQIIRIAP